MSIRMIYGFEEETPSTIHSVSTFTKEVSITADSPVSMKAIGGNDSVDFWSGNSGFTDVCYAQHIRFESLPAAGEAFGLTRADRSPTQRRVSSQINENGELELLNEDTIDATSSGTIEVDKWYAHIVIYDVTNTTHREILRERDTGTEVINVNHSTNGNPDDGLSALHQSVEATPGGTAYVDNIVVDYDQAINLADDVFESEQWVVDSLVPDGNGDLGEWNSHDFEQVDELPTDDATTEIDTGGGASTDKTSLYTLEDTSKALQAVDRIHAIQVNVRGRFNSNSVAANIQAAIRVAGLDFTQEIIEADGSGTSWRWHSDINNSVPDTAVWTTNPATTLEWLPGDLDTMQAGARTTGDAGATRRHSTVFVAYIYTSVTQEPARDRLVELIENPYRSRRMGRTVILDARGRELPLEQVKADQWMLSGFLIPSPVKRNSLIERQDVFYIERKTQRGDTGLSIETSRELLFDALLARLGRST